jgi:hypothetical protein
VRQTRKDIHILAKTSVLEDVAALDELHAIVEGYYDDWELGAHRTLALVLWDRLASRRELQGAVSMLTTLTQGFGSMAQALASERSQGGHKPGRLVTLKPGTWVTLSAMMVRRPPRRKAVPWRSTSPEEEHVRFIQWWLEGGVSFVELCRQFGISPKTGYKRLRRFQDWGWEGLGDRSRAPRRHPNATDGAVVERLIAAKRGHLRWSPKKLVA